MAPSNSENGKDTTTLHTIEVVSTVTVLFWGCWQMFFIENDSGDACVSKSTKSSRNCDVFYSCSFRRNCVCTRKLFSRIITLLSRNSSRIGLGGSLQNYLRVWTYCQNNIQSFCTALHVQNSLSKEVLLNILSQTYLLEAKEQNRLNWYMFRYLQFYEPISSAISISKKVMLFWSVDFLKNF